MAVKLNGARESAGRKPTARKVFANMAAPFLSLALLALFGASAGQADVLNEPGASSPTFAGAPRAPRQLAQAESNRRKKLRGQSEEPPPQAEPDNPGAGAEPNDGNPPAEEKPKKAPRSRRAQGKGKAPDQPAAPKAARGKKKKGGNEKELEAIETRLLTPPKDPPDQAWTALWREYLGVAVGLTAESNFPKARVEYDQLDVSDGLALENRTPCRIELLSEWTGRGERDKKKNELRVVGQVEPGKTIEERANEKVFLHIIANDRRGNARGVDFDYFTIRIQPQRTMFEPLDVTIVVEVGLAEDQAVGVNDRDVAWSFFHVLPKEKADDTYQLMASRPIAGVQEIRWIQRHGDPKAQVTERTTIPFINGVQGEAGKEVLTRFQVSP